jgi:hypothetical protein
VRSAISESASEMKNMLHRVFLVVVVILVLAIATVVSIRNLRKAIVKISPQAVESGK